MYLSKDEPEPSNMETKTGEDAHWHEWHCREFEFAGDVAGFLEKGGLSINQVKFAKIVTGQRLKASVAFGVPSRMVSCFFVFYPRHGGYGSNW